MLRAKAPPVLLCAIALGACAVAPPTGPAVLALPPQGKDLAQFQQEDAACRGYAQRQIGYGAAQQAANRNAVGSAAAGTVLGAAAGAAIGAAAGATGVGAAAGAGAGLLAGSAVGANNATASAAVLRERYDFAYAQCMAASGNQVQPLPPALLYAPLDYPGPYSPYYDPWFGSSVGFGFFGFHGARFHHHHHAFFNHGFHHR